MSKYQVRTSNRYERDLGKLSAKDIEKLEIVVAKLANGEPLERKYKDHALHGNYKGFRDCHVKPDLVLIYRINENVLELFLATVGSHSELF